MKQLINRILAIVFTSALALPASAVPFGDGGAALQGVLDGITTNPAGNSSVNVATDELSDANDSYWQVGGSGGSISTIVIELAGFAGQNTFGIFDRSTPGNSVQVFAGAASAGAQATIGILADGSVLLNLADTGVDFGSGNNFGFYLDATANGQSRWFSDTALNSDGLDHMAAYQGVGDQIQIPPFAAGPWSPNEYILAWEDLDGAVADRDYTDFVVLVESVSPTPEPMMLSLLGLGLVGLGFASRRRQA